MFLLKSSLCQEKRPSGEAGISSRVCAKGINWLSRKVMGQDKVYRLVCNNLSSINSNNLSSIIKTCLIPGAGAVAGVFTIAVWLREINPGGVACL